MSYKNGDKTVKKILSKIALTSIIACGILVGGACSNKQMQQTDLDVQWGAVGEVEDLQINDPIPVALLNRKVLVQGEQMDYDSLNVVFPDGTAKTYSKEEDPKLDQVGKYTFIYVKRVDGKIYSDEEVVYVKSKTISLGENSTVFYGRGSNAEDAPDWQQERLAESWKYNADGLVFNLAKNEKVDFNEIIDVSEMKAQSLNDEPLVSLYFNPTNAGSNDIGALYFTLTDSVDPTISLRIKIGVTKEKKTCLTAGGQNQVLTGLEGESHYHRDDGFGTYAYTSMYSFDYTMTISMSNYSVMRINYDARDNAVRVIDSASEAWGSGLKTVADLNSKAFFPTTLWDGFPSGKVRLSMHATDWASPSTQICITSLYGQDNLEEFMNSEIQDNAAPDITLELDDKYVNNMPNARKGDYYYTIPSAVAFDTYSGYCDVTTSVLYENLFNCKIVDDKFKTDKLGVYTIRYVATDKSGNEAVKELYVNCGGMIDDIAFTYNEIPDTVNCGDVLNIPQPEINAVNGEVSYSIRAFDESGNEYDTSKGFFIVKSKGKITLQYAYTEVFSGYTKEDEITLDVLDANKPFLKESIDIEKYFISGAEYTVPEVKAYTYENDVLTEKTVEMYIGATKYQAGETFVPSVNNSGDIVELVFKCGESALCTKSIPTILPYENSELHVENYFVFSEGKGNVSFDKGMSGLSFTSSSAYKMEFARALLEDNFSFTIRSMKGKAKFSSIVYTLTDSQDSTQKVAFEIVYEQAANKYILSIDGNQYPLSQDFNNGEDSLKISYADNCLVFDSFKVLLTKYSDERAFDGFASGCVYLETQVNTNIESVLTISQISGYEFNDIAADIAGPVIIIDSKVVEKCALNQVVTIGKAQAFDVLNSTASVTVTVRGPNGVITSVDGVRLQNADCSREYQIELSSYGQYSIIYDAKDGEGQPARESYTINITDVIPPEVVFSNGFRTTAKVGEEYIIPDYTLSDDVSSQDKLVDRVYILTSFDKIELVENKKYVFKAAGEYMIYVLATDEANNYVFYSVKVTVSK